MELAWAFVDHTLQEVGFWWANVLWCRIKPVCVLNLLWTLFVLIRRFGALIVLYPLLFFACLHGMALDVMPTLHWLR